MFPRRRACLAAQAKPRRAAGHLSVNLQREEFRRYKSQLFRRHFPAQKHFVRVPHLGRERQSGYHHDRLGPQCSVPEQMPLIQRDRQNLVLQFARR